MCKKVLIYALLFFPILVKAQKDGKEISRLLLSADSTEFISFEKTIELTNEVERLITAHGISQFPQELIHCYSIRILTCRYFWRLSRLREYVVRNAELVETLKVPLGSSYQVAKIESDISWANFYALINDHAKSLELFAKALDELRLLPQTPATCRQEANVLNEIASIHNARGEFEAAVNQFVAAIPFEQCAAKDTKADYPVIVLLYSNIGRAYLSKRDFKEAGKFLRLAVRQFASYLDHNPSSASSTAVTLLEAQSSYYRVQNQNDSALLVLQKALSLVKYCEHFRDRVYQNLGETHENLKHYAEAENYYLQELSLFENTEGKNAPRARALQSLGDLYVKQGKTNQALQCYQNAIANLVVNFQSQARENPDLKNILSKKRLFLVLQSKYRAQLKQCPHTDTASTLAAWQTCQLSLALSDSTVNEYSLDRDKVILAERTIQAFEDGLRMKYHLFRQTKSMRHFDDCFRLAERSKGNVLLENLRMVNQFASVDPVLLEKERQIKSELVLTEQGIYKGELAKSQPPDLPTLRERYADLKREYASLMEDIKLHAPDYYKLRFDHHVIDPRKIQTNLLSNGEAIIEFFAGDSTLTTIALSADKRYIDQKKIPSGFLEDLSNFRKFLTDPETSPEQLNIKSKEWYKLLLQDAITNLGGSIHSLVIVPDGVLGYIPFEALVTSDNQFVAEKYSVRYAQSATYLQEQEFARVKKTSSFLAGFVSSALQDIPASTDASSNLVGAQKEVSSIAQLIDNQAILFDPATKQDFLREAPKFHVLHLAMHSMVNEQNPMLSVMAFAHSSDSAESQLTAIEIYNLQLNADLAVLSACNTGFGELHRGEGIMSFARAFSYAGVPSAVISLWEVPDKATSKIMVGFYKHLKEGNSKAKALQLAKAEFIESYPAMAHPFYWSGFILSGSNEPLQFPVSTYWYWISIGVVIAVIMFFMRRRIAVYFKS